jgi:hypothetical protein
MLSDFRMNATIGFTPASPARTIPWKATSFSSWSVMLGSMLNLNRGKSASTASALATFASTWIASMRSGAWARLFVAFSA